MDERSVTVEMELVKGMEFRVRFGEGAGELLMDEPAPGGGGHGPQASKVLAAALGNCLSASLLFCLRKARADVTGMKTTSKATVLRNEKGRFRVTRVDVAITLEGVDATQLGRCGEVFEDYCIVTESVRTGVPVAVEVRDAQGRRLHGAGL